MKRSLLALPVLLLVLAACGDDSGSGDGSGDGSGRGADGGGAGRGADVVADVSACGDLTDADVESLTGQTGVTHVEKDQPFGSVCTFSADGSPSVMILASGGATTAEEIAAAAQTDEGETTTEDVEVPGTDEALLVTETAYGQTTSSLVAVVGPVGYTVYGSGPTSGDEGRVAVAALTILLGGTSDVPVAEPQAHPCDALTGEEVGEVLGAAVTAERGTLADDLRCDYPGPDDVDVMVYTLERTAPVEAVVDGAEQQGATVEQLTVEGTSVASLVQRDGTDAATVYLVTARGVFVLDVDVDDDPERSATLARDLAPLLAA